MVKLRHRRWHRPVGLLALLVLMLLLALPTLPIGGLSSPVWASAQLEARVSQLEFDLRRVRSQLSRLEASRSPGSSGSPAPASSPPVSLPGDPTPSEQFENLAVLALELKQDLRALELRVEQLEASTPSGEGP